MIIDYDHNPNLNTDQKLQSLMMSIQMALNSGEIFTGNKAALDFYHPVGSYFETSDISFNPNKAWGGTWVSESVTIVEDVKAVNVAATIGKARSSYVSINAPTQSGYTFSHWSVVATSGWVGSVCVEAPTAASTNLWNSYSGGVTSGTGAVNATAIYKKTSTKTLWHRTA